jgi:formylglycine-generating enzyme required for sulfatase activity
VTSRYYGNSVDLLDKYSWYWTNSEERAWSCGSLLPNDLGLFDMLGNVNEWCLSDSYSASRRLRKSTYIDNSLLVYVIGNRDGLHIRGGSFEERPLAIRSAVRGTIMGSFSSVNLGFRLARTYP